MKSIKYLSTVNQYIPTNLVSFFGLGYISFNNDDGKYKPDLEFFNESFNDKLIDFEDWWNEVVLANDKESFSRRDIILRISDKEGGAHVDSKISDGQRMMTKENGLGWKVNEIDISDNVFYVSLRVISEEILWSIDFFENSSFESHFTVPSQEIHKRTLPNNNIYFAYISLKMKEISEKLYTDNIITNDVLVKMYAESYTFKRNNKKFRITRIH